MIGDTNIDTSNQVERFAKRSATQTPHPIRDIHMYVAFSLCEQHAFHGVHPGDAIAWVRGVGWLIQAMARKLQWPQVGKIEQFGLCSVVQFTKCCRGEIVANPYFDRQLPVGIITRDQQITLQLQADCSKSDLQYWPCRRTSCCCPLFCPALEVGTSLSEPPSALNHGCIMCIYGCRLGW